MARDAEAAALAAATKLLEEPVEEEATATVAEQETPEGEAPQETEETVLFPEFEIELPEDLVAELAAPTSEEVQQELEEDEEYQELDDEGRRLLARAKAAEREAEFYRAQRVKDERKNWAEEAKKFFPLSVHAIEDIKADSRRGFLRQAKAAHESVLPYVRQAQDAYKADRDTAIEKAVEEAVVKARTEAEAAWGKPSGATGVPAEAAITQEDLARNRAKGDFAATVKSMIFAKKGE